MKKFFIAALLVAATSCGINKQIRDVAVILYTVHYFDTFSGENHVEYNVGASRLDYLENNLRFDILKVKND